MRLVRFAPFIMKKFPETAAYCEEHGLTREILANATQIAWATGGRLVPEEIWDEYLHTYMGT